MEIMHSYGQYCRHFAKRLAASKLLVNVPFRVSPQLHLLRIVHMALDLVGDGLADAALHLELGGCAVGHADAQADGELAVVISGVFRLAPVRGEEFADVVE